MWEEIHALLSQSWSRIFTAVANFLPGLLALLVILLFTIAVAALARSVLRRFLRGIHFDEWVVRWGFPDIAEWSPKRSPSLLLVRIVSWTILILGFLAGIAALDAALPSMLVVRLFDYIPNVLAALLVLAVGIFASRFLARSVLISAVNMKLQSARLLSVGVKWLVLVLSGAMALQHLRIGGSIVTLSFGILFGGIVLALALAVGLGSKDMVSRSWEQQSQPDKETEEHLHHL
jgi:Mechanosensitive ion channel, conserved TM helix